MDWTGEPPPELDAVARRLFGDRLPLAVAYARALCTDGVVRGLIGPREAPRMWDRHLVNCALPAELIPTGVTVIDVGSGAGLPGLVLAIARPDLEVTLIEPLARRVAFLDEVVDRLGLDTVTVIRGRADEVARDHAPAAVVTARAVAPLDRLVTWCLPLAAVGRGRLLAIKGAGAADEIEEHMAAVRRLGGSVPRLRRCEFDGVEPTLVVDVVRERVVSGATARQTTRRPRRSDTSGPARS